MVSLYYCPSDPRGTIRKIFEHWDNDYISDTFICNPSIALYLPTYVPPLENIQRSDHRDLWHLRHWLQYRQLRTWINDNLCYLTINCDTGQHSQFLRCFYQNIFQADVKPKSAGDETLGHLLLIKGTARFFFEDETDGF